jgi:hypothetical protein
MRARERADGAHAGAGTARAHGGRVMDLVLLLATIAFFALAWLYASACERVG